jgi:hypothetical protein
MCELDISQFSKKKNWIFQSRFFCAGVNGFHKVLLGSNERS